MDNRNIITHFGLNLMQSKYGLKLTRDKYAIINNKSSFKDCLLLPAKYYTDETGKFYTDEWCIKHQKDCLDNFDLSMKYFSLLNKNEFDSEINKFLKKYKSFKKVMDLNNYENISGVYLMVLDKYKQLYIGVSNNIKRRIKQHWINYKSFDRLLFPIGAVETSVMCIDSFRALDTTRIYISQYDNYFDVEDKYINYFSPKFLCNRIGGGKYGDSLSMAIYALSTMKSKELK